MILYGSSRHFKKLIYNQFQTNVRFPWKGQKTSHFKCSLYVQLTFGVVVMSLTLVLASFGMSVIRQILGIRFTHLSE